MLADVVRTRVLPQALSTVFDEEVLDSTKIWVDFAVEVQHEDRGISLYTRASGHALLIQSLAGLSEAEATKRVKAWGPSSVYQKDHTALLAHWAGFHINWVRESYPRGISYLQVYHSDKALAYSSSSQNKVVPLHPIEFLTTARGSGRTFQHWSQHAKAALEAQDSRQNSNSVRIEVTVRLDSLLPELLWLEDEVLQVVLEPIPRHVMM